MSRAASSCIESAIVRCCRASVTPATSSATWQDRMRCNRYNAQSNRACDTLNRSTCEWSEAILFYSNVRGRQSTFKDTPNRHMHCACSCCCCCCCPPQSMKFSSSCFNTRSSDCEIVTMTPTAARDVSSEKSVTSHNCPPPPSRCHSSSNGWCGGGWWCVSVCVCVCASVGGGDWR